MMKTTIILGLMAIAAAQTTMVPFIAAGIFYYVFNAVVAFLMEMAEKKLSYYE